jgi:hypothetical protein
MSKQANNIKPPLMTCILHGVQRGYLYCHHIRDKIKAKQKFVVEVQLPVKENPSSFGLLLCTADKHRPSDLRLICEQCALKSNILLQDVVERTIAKIHEYSIHKLDRWETH